MSECRRFLLSPSAVPSPVPDFCSNAPLCAGIRARAPLALSRPHPLRDCGTEAQGDSDGRNSRALVQALVAALLPAGALAGPVNVNTADAATLARELDGIGPAKAQAIVDYRGKNGPFRAAEDLLKVQGIGERVLEQNRANIRLDKAGAAPRPANPRRAQRSLHQAADANRRPGCRPRDGSPLGVDGGRTAHPVSSGPFPGVKQGFSMTSIRTAVFPVAGRGTRFLPATKASPKEMLPIVDKPLIQYAVEEALAAGARKLVFITGCAKRAIEDHFDTDHELEKRARGAGQARAARRACAASCRRTRPASTSASRRRSASATRCCARGRSSATSRSSCTSPTT